MTGDPRLTIHPDLPAFLSDCTAVLQQCFVQGLRSVYVIGSVATGDAAVQYSDVDLLAVVEGETGAAAAVAGERLAEVAMRCPLRGLEAVIYRKADLIAPQHPLPYLVNVNAGPRMARSVTHGGDPAFWFLLDVAAARDHAIAVLGAPAAAVIGEVPSVAAASALAESLAWHRAEATAHPNAVLNACRAWHWCATGLWASKGDAGRWAVEHAGPQVVRDALALRRACADHGLSTTAVALFLHQVEDVVRASCLQTVGGSRL